MSDNDVDELLEEADRELESCTEANRRTGHIILRVWKIWVRKAWLPHVQAEHDHQVQLRAYKNAMRFVLAGVCAIGALAAWVLHQVGELAALLRIGMGGP